MLRDFAKQDLIKPALVLVIILFSSFQKYKVFDESGGELTTFVDTVYRFTHAENPYIHTWNTYRYPDQYRDKGYAYMPSLLYIQTPLYLLARVSDLPLQRLWKAPVLVADVGTALVLIIFLYKKNYWALLVGLLVWLLNPYFVVNRTYSYTEPLGIFFMVLALHLLGKKDFLTGMVYAAAVSFKAFPIVLFPLFFLGSKRKLRFLTGGFVFALAISVPFILSREDLLSYINSVFLVHSTREPQGRPILFFIKWVTGLNVFDIAYLKIYVYLATFSGWIMTPLLYLTKKLTNKYILAMLSFVPFYLFTPVLNRTYLIWFIPILILGAIELFSYKYKVMYYITVMAFYLFYAWYLSLWVRGVRVFDGTVFL